MIECVFLYYKFQSGALDGIVELTPLAQAAAKGLNAMVQLLLDSGANINYFCAVSLSLLAIMSSRVHKYKYRSKCP